MSSAAPKAERKPNDVREEIAMRATTLTSLFMLPSSARVRFDGFGCWFLETEEGRGMNTRQVIGLRREVSSKQERGVQRRKRLVDAARHFLETRDPQEISFKEIAKYAEVPEGSAYHFFANKYDVFSALAADLGQSFAERISEPVNANGVQTWQEFISLAIDRSALIYRSDTVARKVLLGSTMPHEVKNVDSASIETYISIVEARLHELFEMPQIDRLSERLLYALTMVDALFELDLNTHDNLSDEIIEEVKLMMVGYLANFIPADLHRRDSV